MAGDEGEVAGRNPVRGRRHILAAAVLTLALGSFGALSWSLIPVSVHGRVTGVGYQSDSGLRWRIIGLSKGPDRVVDKSVVEALGGRRRLVGRQLDKSPFSATMAVDSGRTDLAVSPTSWQVIAVIAVLGSVAAFRPRRRSLDGSERRRAGTDEPGW